MKATIKDLELELWLRKRERGEIVWTTKSGAEIPINEMSDTHIENRAHGQLLASSLETALQMVLDHMMKVLE